MKTKAFDSALRLLSRREHDAKELFDKLQHRGFSRIDASEALQKCQELDLQNEHRYVEIYCRSRTRQGYGPLKIAQELYMKGVSQELADKYLNEENWLCHALDVWFKKTKQKDTISFEELQKTQRFLQYRGFSTDTIAIVIKELKSSHRLFIDTVSL